LTSTAKRATRGTSSCKSPSRLAPSSPLMELAPVILPPGRLRLATRPVWTGSPPALKTIGMVVVACEQRRRHFEAERLSGFQVDDQLEPGWLGDRQIARLGTFEYLSGINASIATSSVEAGSVAGQTSFGRRPARPRSGRRAPSGRLIAATATKRFPSTPCASRSRG
jgi:hypothetical protein